MSKSKSIAIDFLFLLERLHNEIIDDYSGNECISENAASLISKVVQFYECHPGVNKVVFLDVKTILMAGMIRSDKGTLLVESVEQAIGDINGELQRNTFK